MAGLGSNFDNTVGGDQQQEQDATCEKISTAAGFLIPIVGYSAFMMNVREKPGTERKKWGNRACAASIVGALAWIGIEASSSSS
mmetsp:Transcript_54119/g.85740  ORF Transcript_54119/g.85740 Transcript_54119/m.85740 type:complete len:84 (-) Transcript_54119:153-404(-)